MTDTEFEGDVRAEGEPEREFHAGIAARWPRKTVSGGALIRDAEVCEELGLDLPVGPALVIDWVPASGPWHDALHVVFDGGVLHPATIERIAPDPVEVRGFDFLPLTAASDRLRPSMARRLAAAQLALEGGETLYAEFGRPVDGPP